MRRRVRRANAAITALSLSVLLGFGALAVDVAVVRVTNAQLQSAIDAAALAAAARLDGTEAALDGARAAAVEVAALNPVLRGFTLEPEQVVFGSWTEDTGFVPGVDAAEVDAVRIEVRLEGLPAVLAGAAFDRDTLSTAASTMAARPRGGPASDVDCWLPIALPYCRYADLAGTVPDPVYVRFGTDKVDDVGFAHPEGSNTDALRKLLQGDCSISVGVGDTMHVSNGGNNAVLQEATKILNGKSEGNVSPWPYETFPDGPPARAYPDAFDKSDSTVADARWGHVIAGPVALVELDCDAPKFTDQGGAPPKIVGFTYGFIYDVLNGNAHDSGFMLQLDFANDYGGGTDDRPGADGNTIQWFGPPVLVR